MECFAFSWKTAAGEVCAWVTGVGEGSVVTGATALFMHDFKSKFKCTLYCKVEDAIRSCPEMRGAFMHYLCNMGPDVSSVVLRSNLDREIKRVEAAMMEEAKQTMQSESTPMECFAFSWLDYDAGSEGARGAIVLGVGEGSFKKQAAHFLQQEMEKGYSVTIYNTVEDAIRGCPFMRKEFIRYLHSKRVDYTRDKYRMELKREIARVEWDMTEEEI